MSSARWRRLLMLAALAASLGGCTVIAVTGAVVGAGVAVTTAAVKGTVAVGKGVASIVSDDDEEEIKKQKKEN